MSSSSEESETTMTTKKYKGIRRRKWGKWVSEIRVPGTPERLWLGSYATPEGAAVAHDVAFYCLRGNSSPQNLNFPLVLPAGARPGLSPRSVQRTASDAGLATDARLTTGSRGDESAVHLQSDPWSGSNNNLNVSVEDYLYYKD